MADAGNIEAPEDSTSTFLLLQNNWKFLSKWFKIGSI